MGRRTVSFTAVGLGLPLLVATSVVWVPITIMADLVSRLFKFPTFRLGLFAVVYLAHEWAGIAAAGTVKVAHVLGRGPHDPVSRTHDYRRIQGWWATSLFAWAGRLLGVRFDLSDPATLPSDGFILMSRHASMIDAILPAHIIAGQLGRFVHYVIKRELLWDPNIDVIGSRLGNYFVARDGDADDEAQAIASIASFARRALPQSALAIFPEGTYATEARRARARASLERNGDSALAALADDLDYLLPPRPAGALAMLNNQPTLDVVIFGHVGLEGVAELSGLRRRLPLQAPVVVRWWTYDRATVPVDDEARIAWLNERWRSLDDWVGSLRRPNEREANNG